MRELTSGIDIQLSDSNYAGFFIVINEFANEKCQIAYCYSSSFSESKLLINNCSMCVLRTARMLYCQELGNT